MGLVPNSINVDGDSVDVLTSVTDSATTADMHDALGVYCQPFVLPRSDRICLSVLITAAILILCDPYSKTKSFLASFGLLVGATTIIDECTKIRGSPLATTYNKIIDELSSRSVL